jgi:TRAP-type C4-dicarboxylate transport system substrate-binding protein
MKKLACIFGAIILMAGLVGPALVQAAEKELPPLKVKTATWHTRQSLLGDSMVNNFMRIVTQKSGGKITFDPIYWGTLGTPTTFIDLASKGAVDLVSTGAGYTPGKFPLGGFEFVFPFGPPDPRMTAKAKRATYDAIPAFRKECEKNNVVSLMHVALDSYAVFSQKPYKSLADWKGQKIGSYGPYVGKILDGAGAAFVSGAVMNYYDWMRAGTVDAIIVSNDLASAYSLYEQAKYWDDSFWGSFLPTDLWMNMDYWKSLTPRQQQIFREAGLEAENAHAEFIVANRAKTKEKLHKLTVVQMPREEVVKWANACMDVPAWWAKEMEKQGLPVAWEIVERYQKEVEKLGFKWARKWGVK